MFNAKFSRQPFSRSAEAEVSVNIVISGGGGISITAETEKNLDIVVSGGGSLSVTAETERNIDISIFGGGGVAVDGLQVKSFSVSITGGGGVDVDIGKISLQEIIVSGGGGIILDIETERNVDIVISGGGEISINTIGYVLLVSSDMILEPLGLRVLRDSRYELFPSLKEFKEEIPGKHGEILFDTKLNRRILELHVVTDDDIDYTVRESKKREIASILDPTKGVQALVFEDDLNKKYYVKYSGKIDVKQYSQFMDFVVPFVMPNPYIVARTKSTQVGNGTITNNGSVETPLLITITGELIDPEIVIGSDTLSYDGTVGVGETLVIDTENMTVKLDGANALSNYSGGFPKLQTGETVITADNKVTLSWRERWV
jgi:predicted phage tail component-like protein